jgi:hypothetical protein
MKNYRGTWKRDPKKRAEESKAYYAKNKKALLEKALNRTLARHGITADAYRAMLTQQGGGCAICKKKKERRRLSIDHCHQTGQVRGILCDTCNRGIGLLGDSPELLQAALGYLTQGAS